MKQLFNSVTPKIQSTFLGFMLLNLAIGGGWGGQEGIDDSIFPQKYKIDYVRVYQRH